MGLSAILMLVALICFVVDQFVSRPNIKFMSLGLAFMAASFLAAGMK